MLGKAKLQSKCNKKVYETQLLFYNMPVERISDKTEEIITEYIKEKILQEDKRFRNPMKLTFDKVLQIILEELSESQNHNKFIFADYELLEEDYKRVTKLYNDLYEMAKKKLDIKLEPEDTPEALEKAYRKQQEDKKNRNTQEKTKKA